MMMVRLNTRHQLPQIGIRQTQGRLDEAAIIQPQTRGGNNRQARSNQGVTQPGLSIDNYPSRRAYGFRTMGDLMTEQGRRGLSDVQAAIGRHAQENWTIATTAAQRGNDITQKIRAEIFSDYEARAVFKIDAIPDPTVQGHPNEVVGEPDTGDSTVDIQTAPNARIHYTPGSVQTYLQNEGFIHSWVSYNQYDIYA
ncbi:MAG: hypothetical protein SR2Q5_02650 [Quinella sp. 2Q5]|nr:hypothetical protein [Quinella sp. 2Q5]